MRGCTGSVLRTAVKSVTCNKEARASLRPGRQLTAYDSGRASRRVYAHALEYRAQKVTLACADHQPTKMRRKLPLRAKVGTALIVAVDACMYTGMRRPGWSVWRTSTTLVGGNRMRHPAGRSRVGETLERSPDGARTRREDCSRGKGEPLALGQAVEDDAIRGHCLIRQLELRVVVHGPKGEGRAMRIGTTFAYVRSSKDNAEQMAARYTNELTANHGTSSAQEAYYAAVFCF